jgi:uncharacterized spore protein YtfJ
MSLLSGAPIDLENLFRLITDKATIKNVFGDAILAGDKTIVPVARVAFGFGGGTGSGPQGKGEGSGGGGGVRAVPAGVLEVTPDETRFIAFADKRRMAAALGAGLLLGMLMARRL